MQRAASGRGMPLWSGHAVKVFCALWSGHAAATWCAVLPGVRFGAGKLMPLQGAACAMLPGWGVRFGAGKLVPLQGAAWGA